MSHKMITLTHTGKADLEAKIYKLQSKISNLAESVDRVIKQLGIHDDNYHERLELKKVAEAELAHLQEILQRARLVQSVATDKVAIGSTVQLMSDSVVREYQVVETIEANPLCGKVSDVSPLGKSLLGKKKGEEVSIVSPQGTLRFLISAIQ